MFRYVYFSKGSIIHGISLILLNILNPNIPIKEKKNLNFRPMHSLILKLSDLSENKDIELNIVSLHKVDVKQTS